MQDNRIPKAKFIVGDSIFFNEVRPRHPIKRIDFEGETVYRFFREKTYAEAFCQGKIRLSTLAACRGYENARQGDKDEGIQTHVVSVNGFPSEERVKLGVRVAGLQMGENIHYDLSNVVSRRYIKDAYVLCTTETYEPSKMSDDFGKYCVKIEIPQLFFNLVTMRLEMQKGAMAARLASVEYKVDFDSWSDRNLGFTKAPDQYAEQKEARMLWVPIMPQKIEPFILVCPEVEQLCELISL
jgi:hypothetical protein